jgi:hypothetical protein
MGRQKWQYDVHSITYNSWRSMRNRVLYDSSPAHKFYKEKEITICARWVDNFDAFVEDMGERPWGTTLDRIDGSKGYFPDNCRWASHREQQNNKITLTKVEKDGEIKTIGEWAFILDLTSTELSKVYKRHSKYKATSYEELFCDHLRAFRNMQRTKLCLVCGNTESCKWRKEDRLCNTCYHKGLRWSKKENKLVNLFPAWEGIFN